MQDYSISKCTRKCAVSGRALNPGEGYISVIRPAEDESVHRVDVAASEWKGPDEETIAWWRSRMPEAGPKKLRPAPNGVLLDTLGELLERPGNEALAYLLSLLLVRRRVLLEEESLADELNSADKPGEAAEDPERDHPEYWLLSCNADNRKWNVPVVAAAPEQLFALQEELNDLLFTEE